MKKYTYMLQLVGRLRLMERLKAFNPLVVGTIPLDIDVAGSDVDVICEASNLSSFVLHCQREFGEFRGFSSAIVDVRHEPSAVVTFVFDLPFELFAQTRSSREQWGYRHFIIEQRLLALASDNFRQRIRALKQGGMKTEPAFAQLLGIEGDPYVELLQLEEQDDESLRAWVAGVD